MGAESNITNIAAIYDKRSLISFDGNTIKATVDNDISLITTLKLPPSAEILDIGCGGGWHLKMLEELGYTQLTGIDISAGALITTKCIVSKMINADFLKYHFNKSYELITNFHSCYGQVEKHMETKFFKKIYKSLKIGGYMVLTIFTTEKASELVGRFCVKYDSDSDEYLLSEVEYDKGKKRLTIRQEIDSFVCLEQMRLYESPEIAKILQKIGFAVKIINHHSNFCTAFIAQKQ